MEPKLRKPQFLFSFACYSHGIRIKNAKIYVEAFELYNVFVGAFLKSRKAFKEAQALH